MSKRWGLVVTVWALSLTACTSTTSTRVTTIKREERPSGVAANLPAVSSLDELIRWLELRRTVAVEVDGLAPDSPEVREMEAQILASTEAWGRERRAELEAERRTLRGSFGAAHSEVQRIEAEIQAVAERVRETRARFGASDDGS